MRKLTAISIAAILAATVAGCGGATQPGAGAPRAGQEYTTVKAVALQADQAPQELRNWAFELGMPTKPNYKLITADGSAYAAIAAGEQTSGGYKVEVTDIQKNGGAWVVSAKLTPPPPGSIVTMALTTPVGYFKLPNVSGDVQVKMDGALVESTAPAGAPAGGGAVSVLPIPGNLGGLTVDWTQGNILKVSGTAKVPDVHFVVKKGGQVLAQADAQVKDGRYISNIIVEGGPMEGLTLELSDPATGEILVSVPVAIGSAPGADGSIIARDEVWSENFRVVNPRQTGKSSIQIEGKARAFEGVFLAEVRSGGKVLLSKWVRASEGAPSYGRFAETLEVPGGVPAGAEVAFLLESAKDGSKILELTVPVLPAK